MGDTEGLKRGCTTFTHQLISDVDTLILTETCQSPKQLDLATQSRILHIPAGIIGENFGKSYFRKVHHMNDPKLVRMQEKGQVTIPTEIRKKLGLKRGDLVAVTETPDGVFITPQQVVATKALGSIGDILKEQGLLLDELIASGRDIRTDLIQETYGITEPPKENFSR
jgi:AbrB family looped-hinge helix DNA binding protein